MLMRRDSRTVAGRGVHAHHAGAHVPLLDVLRLVRNTPVDQRSGALIATVVDKSLARRGRMVTLGGAGKSFQVSAFDLLYKEQVVLGSRYVTRREILETFDLVARGEIWPVVSDVRPWTEAEAVHERVERGAIVGRAALLIG